MLKRKIRRDIMDYKVQFISIFLMAFIGVSVFAGMHVETASFESTINDYYEQSNLADGWIYSNYLVDEFLQQTYLLGATTQMERQLVVDSHAILNNDPDVVLHFVENNTISKFYLLEGKELDINDSEGVWLDKSFADANNLTVGDEISFKSNGIEIKKEIRGLGYSPEYVYDVPKSSTVPNHTASGFAYLSHKAFPSNNITYNVLNVKFEGSPDMYSKLLDYRLDGYYTTFLEKSDHYSVDVVSELISQQKSMSDVFPIIFIIISMLILSTTLKRMVSHQRTEIGILKANGFKNYTIIGHYMIPSFLLILSGSILGAILGPIIFHMLVNPSRILFFKFPYWNSVGYNYSIIMVLFMGAMSLFISYHSIKNIINEPVSSIMKSKTPKSSKLSFIEKFKFWNNISFNLRWNFRNTNRNKGKAIMTVLGIIGCTVLLITGLGLYENVNDAKYWYFNDVNHFESKLITDNDMGLSEINAIANDVNGYSIMDTSIELFSNTTEMASLLVLNGSNLITMTDDGADAIKIGNDEVSISKKMADLMNVNVGDTIDGRMVGSEKNVEITINKIHSSPFSQGLVMSPDKLNELGLNYTPTGIITSQHVSESPDGITNTIYLNDMITGWNTMEESTMIIINALVIGSIILAMVILYNMNILYYTEMENDITILKVLGFKRRHLTKILATQSLFLIIIGYLIGIPISKYILSIVMPAFGKDIYLLPTISPENLVITFILIISVSMIMNLYFSYKIKNIDMPDSLKELER